MNEVNKLIDRIKLKIREYFRETDYTEDELARAFGVSIKMIRSWDNGNRIFRLIHWDKFNSIFKDDPKNLYIDLVKYREHLTERFNEYYIKRKNLFNKLVNGKQYPYYYDDREDILQKVYRTFWERMDDLDNRESLTVGTFMGWIAKKVFDRVHMDYQRGMRKNPNDIMSLDYKLNVNDNGEEFTVADTIIDEDSVIDYDITADKFLLESMMENLKPMEKRVLKQRFFYGETLEIIGENVGLSKERIRQIEEIALRKIREELN